MAQATTNNKTIAKNTILLYFRMIIIMLISLYTSRVILRALGEDDVGIYGVVGGIVAMFSFLNSAFATGTSRFLTFALGEKSFEKSRNTFSLTLNIHILIAFFICLISGIIGPWFIQHKLIIPPDRMDAALFAFYCSIIAVAISITQIPYNASIIAHEKMNIFAYLSILEVALKLAIVYLLTLDGFDKLKLYAVLILVVQLLIAAIYRYYCVRNFKECKYRFFWDKKLFLDITKFSGWSLIGSLSHALTEHGASLVMNMFFAPAVIAARSFAMQINTAVTQFTNNFRTAVNPQIIKSCAQQDISRMRTLVSLSTVFSFYLLLLIELPIFLEVDIVLRMWLENVPAYTSEFVRFTLVYSLLAVFDISFYIVMNAYGKMKMNAIMTALISIWVIPVTYFFYLYGFSPIAFFIIMLIKVCIISFIVKPWLLVKYFDYEWKFIWTSIFYPCLKVFIIAPVLPLILFYNISVQNNLIHLLIISLSSVFSVVISVYLFGLTMVQKKQILFFIKGYILKKQTVSNGKS